MMLSGVLALEKDAQIRQPIVALVSVEVVDFLVASEASSETLSDDKAMLIDASPVVGH